MPSNRNYWEKRTKQLANDNYKRVADFEKKMVDEMQKQLADIEKETNNLLMKYAKDNKLTFADAQQIIKPIELSEYKEKLQDFRDYMGILGEENTLAMMKTLTAKQNMTRYEYMKNVIQMEINKLSASQAKEVNKFLTGFYQTTYDNAQTIICDKIKIPHAFITPAIETLAPIIQYPYSGDMFSNRIWKANEKIKEKLVETLTNGMVQGKSIDKMSADLRKRMFDSTGNNYSTYDIRRIIRTESAFIQEKAMSDVNKSYGIEQYVLITTSGCCKKCHNQNRKIFFEDDRVIGKNAPPFHPNCRCTTAPAMEHDEIERTRNEYLEGLKKRKEAKKRVQQAMQQNAPQPTQGYTEEFYKKKYPMLQTFEDKFTSQGLTTSKDFIKHLGDKIETAPPELQKMFMNSDDLKFQSVTSTGTSFYSSKTNSITFNMKNVNGTYYKAYQDTFFHEVGHYFDMKDRNFGRLCEHTNAGQNFGKLLRQEAVDMVNEFKKDQLFDKKYKMYTIVGHSKEKAESMAFYDVWQSKFQNPQAVGGISDILSGVTSNKFVGDSCHSNDYWNQYHGLVPMEAFAHLTAAFCNTKDNKHCLRLWKRFFPKSVQCYLDIIKEATE